MTNKFHATALDTGPIVFSPINHVPATPGAEKSDSYPRVIARLNPKWRAITCADDIQWILQHRRGKTWRGRSYCQTRAVLLRCVHDHAGLVDAAALALLDALPDRIGGTA